jgi:putative membrane protein
MRTYIFVASALLSMGSLALAQTAHDNAAPEGPGKVKQAVTRMMLTNESFVEKAGVSSLAEIEASKLALQKSQDPQVRSFAQRMIDDHTSATNQLTAIAQTKKMMVPSELDSAHKKAVDKLTGLSGKEFDAAYTLQMQDDHETAVTLFTSASEDKSIDAEFQALARKLLPTLRNHQSDAHKLDHAGHANSNK